MSLIQCERNDHNYWSMQSTSIKHQLIVLLVWTSLVTALATDLQMGPLTACQHLRQAETRRSRALRLEPGNGRQAPVPIPECSPYNGAFEPVQCSNEIAANECWCVDEMGVELAGTRRPDQPDRMRCNATDALAQAAAAANNSSGNSGTCAASSCRMYCPAGFARDPHNGCPKCQCRDPCAGIDCPGGQSCQLQVVTCPPDQPCPPVPTCKKARSLSDLCPAGQPLTIADTPRPFLCGHEPGKPHCPPVYRCLVQSGNDYGVCCPAAIAIQKPGQCPQREHRDRSADAGQLCGAPCAGDLECPGAEKCCQTDGCGGGGGGGNCRPPLNGSACQHARLAAELMAVGEREGRGYVPECDAVAGGFASRQCSRNGLVCWCVDQRTGHKMRDTMGAAGDVDCRWQRPLSNKLETGARSQSRSMDDASSISERRCDQNICAAVCEYGFKIDHNGCPTCECAEPCEGYRCAAGSHCEVAHDLGCSSASSALCASEPVCKPDLVYTNPCDVGVPLAHNVSGEVQYCQLEEQRSREFQAQSYWDLHSADVGSSRSIGDLIECPAEFRCTKLYRENANVCCPNPQPSAEEPIEESRSQSMCEYLRDFSDRMEGTEAGMVLALPTPTCSADGHFEPRICVRRTLHLTRTERTRWLEEQNVRQMRALFLTQPAAGAVAGTARSPRSARENLKLYKVSESDTVVAGAADRSGDSGTVEPQVDVKAIIRYLRANGNTANAEANYMAEILSRKLLSTVVMQARSAKVIDGGGRSQSTVNMAQSLERGAGKVAPATRSHPVQLEPHARQPAKPDAADGNALVVLEVDECFCVDGFGTEIPQSRGFNVSSAECVQLRESLDCLDITCRMGCDYGFILDPQTRCPTCECRDPCDNVACPDGQECRSVEVSCEGEYCPPVPACLPRKPGQCPFLVPPGTEGSTIDSCEYECRSDQHCAGSRRCCSNGCGTQCVEPQLKTACQHLQTIQLHQATELGVPPKQKYIAQCNGTTGAWLRMQCGPNEACWCVDAVGQELPGTRRSRAQLAVTGKECDEMPTSVQSRRNDDTCPEQRCAGPCEFGYQLDEAGCRQCECRQPCDEIACPGGEECQLMRVECIDEPCPKMPVCVPHRAESVCSEGRPFRRNGQALVCGPQGDADACPSTHTCQLDVESKRGVCCAKTRDVCFESVDNKCVQNNSSSNDDTANMSLQTWRFSPKLNKCVQMLAVRTCQSKNLFHSEAACTSVCPILSACERLRLRNSLAGKRLQQSAAWFQPRCDPETGSWSPVQCLGKSPPPSEAAADSAPPSNGGGSRAFHVHEPPAVGSAGSSQSITANAVGVCWCADKKGAPLHGSLTRGIEPQCNHRQARRRKLATSATTAADSVLLDPMVEQLIGQLTLMADDDNLIGASFNDDALLLSDSSSDPVAMVSVTERILQIAQAADRVDLLAAHKIPIYAEDDQDDDQEDFPPFSTRLHRAGTRCQMLRSTAALHPVACNAAGAFLPQQCNDEAVCWCVDAAGNQLPQSDTFAAMDNNVQQCPPAAPIERVAVELMLGAVPGGGAFAARNLYDVIRSELALLFDGQLPENLRVHELLRRNGDRLVRVQFDLTGGDGSDGSDATPNAVDTAFALEEMVRNGQLRLAHGRLVPDVTQSRFTHRAGAAALDRSQTAATPAVTAAAAASGVLPGPQSTALRPESAFQMIVFVLATTSAFLVSVFVVFVMLKRGRSAGSKMNGAASCVAGTQPEAAGAKAYATGGGRMGMGDKFLDYSSPIFVLSPSEMKHPMEDKHHHP